MHEYDFTILGRTKLTTSGLISPPLASKNNLLILMTFIGEEGQQLRLNNRVDVQDGRGVWREAVVTAVHSARHWIVKDIFSGSCL